MQEFRERLAGIEVEYDGKTVGLEDICFRLDKDMSCQVQSVLSFWGKGPTKHDVPDAVTAMNRLRLCLQNMV